MVCLASGKFPCKDEGISVYVVFFFDLLYVLVTCDDLRFTNALAGLNINDMIQRTGGRLDSLHSEGIHVRRVFPCLSYNIKIILSNTTSNFLFWGG